MGSNISIVNETDQVLHICLKQVFPLYFENYVKPGQVVSRNVGKVWFTIEARVASDKNKYSTGQSALECALFTTVTVINILGHGMSTAAGDFAIGANSCRVVCSPGWYLGYSRRVEIRYKSTIKESNQERGITDVNIRKILCLVEVCSSGCGRENKGTCPHCSRRSHKPLNISNFSSYERYTNKLY